MLSHKNVCRLALILGCSRIIGAAQFLPEIDAHLKVNSDVRAYLEVKNDRDGGDPTQFAIGPSIQFYRKPLLRLEHVTAFDLDDSKSRALVLETGYRYITVPDGPTKNRMLVAATFNFPLRNDFWMSDRNRADLDWRSDRFSWRYRNKLKFQRTCGIFSLHFTPYVAVEPYYESQYHKWSTTALSAGSLFRVGNHVEFNLYYEHDNSTGVRPNRQTSSIGLVLDLYFP